MQHVTVFNQLMTITPDGRVLDERIHHIADIDNYDPLMNEEELAAMLEGELTYDYWDATRATVDLHPSQYEVVASLPEIVIPKTWTEKLTARESILGYIIAVIQIAIIVLWSTYLNF